jgi:hypothetical protein
MSDINYVKLYYLYIVIYQLMYGIFFTMLHTIQTVAMATKDNITSALIQVAEGLELMRQVMENVQTTSSLITDVINTQVIQTTSML